MRERERERRTSGGGRETREEGPACNFINLEFTMKIRVRPGGGIELDIHTVCMGVGVEQIWIYIPYVWV